MTHYKALLIPIGVIGVAFLVCLIAPGWGGHSRPLLAAAHLTFVTVGGFISLIAAVELVLRAVRGEPALGLIPWIVVLLAGILMVSLHWGIAISLAGIGIALTVRDIVRGRVSVSDEPQPISSPTGSPSAD